MNPPRYLRQTPPAHSNTEFSGNFMLISADTDVRTATPHYSERHIIIYVKLLREKLKAPQENKKHRKTHTPRPVRIHHRRCGMARPSRESPRSCPPQRGGEGTHGPHPESVTETRTKTTGAGVLLTHVLSKPSQDNALPLHRGDGPGPAHVCAPRAPLSAPGTHVRPGAI
ncbi:hypothetical protein HEK616_74690 (plasmid) [Streptomyces nigrescens]|uniref:Uncharacterized protein n=1 Tax=Streptomyces nigrescens TaxID=1920 RepID=A0ABN6R6D1_STRNI|nr:hypothetical protein HEK616_74690 [Streptomyces nigrescens]